MSAAPIYVFDLDGTLADISHRLPLIQDEPKKWDEFFAACEEDEPIEHMCDLARLLVAGGKKVVFASGRSDAVRTKTDAWLERQGLGNLELYMRRAGDHRPDNEVKADLLAEMRADGFEPVLVFDDRTQVVEMWRAAGIPCAQVAEGNF